MPVCPNAFGIISNGRVFRKPFNRFNIYFAVKILNTIRLYYVSCILVIILLQLFHRSAKEMNIHIFFVIKLAIVHIVPKQGSVFPFKDLAFVFVLFAFVNMTHSKSVIIFIHMGKSYFFVIGDI